MLPTHHILDTDWGEPVNTFDRPILEHTMASKSLILDDELLAPYVMARVDFRSTFAHRERLDDSELAERCAKLRIMGSFTPFACLAELTNGDVSKLPYEYVHAVMGALRVQPTSVERQGLIHRLLDLGHVEEAVSFRPACVALSSGVSDRGRALQEGTSQPSMEGRR